MLVIRRKPGESVVLGNRITVTVLESKGGAVKLGIDAPADVSIHRQEILTEVEAANRAATAVAPDPKLFADLKKDRPRED